MENLNVTTILAVVIPLVSSLFVLSIKYPNAWRSLYDKVAIVTSVIYFIFVAYCIGHSAGVRIAQETYSIRTPIEPDFFQIAMNSLLPFAGWLALLIFINYIGRLTNTDQEKKPKPKQRSR